MKKTTILLIILSLALLSSCCKRTIGTTITKTVYIKDSTGPVIVKERTIDTFLKRDTVTNTIQLECDKNNKVVVKGTTNNKGSRTNQYFNLDNKGNLSVMSVCDSLRLQLEAKDSIINHYKTIETEINKETVIEKKKTLWETIGFYVIHGIFIVLILLAGWLIGKFVKLPV